jgi:hypothetical protein
MGMADYYALISEAIADKKTAQSRLAFYDRARTILVDKLRKADPPLSETIIDQERLALEHAISKVEADATGSEGTPPTPTDLQTQSDLTDDRGAALEAAWAPLQRLRARKAACRRRQMLLCSSEDLQPQQRMGLKLSQTLLCRVCNQNKCTA